MSGWEEIGDRGDAKQVHAMLASKSHSGRGAAGEQAAPKQGQGQSGAGAHLHLLIPRHLLSTCLLYKLRDAASQELCCTPARLRWV